MDYLKSNSKINNLEHETIKQIKKLAQYSKKLTFDSILEKLSSNTNNDEKFVLMLISILNKKCSSELLLALLYIVS